MHNKHASNPLPNLLRFHHIPLSIRLKTSCANKRGTYMIILTALRAIGAFFASLPGSFAEAQKLRREFYRRHPFVEF
jgi:hypothetical protein